MREIRLMLQDEWIDALRAGAETLMDVNEAAKVVERLAEEAVKDPEVAWVACRRVAAIMRIAGSSAERVSEYLGSVAKQAESEHVPSLLAAVAKGVKP